MLAKVRELILGGESAKGQALGVRGKMGAQVWMRTLLRIGARDRRGCLGREILPGVIVIVPPGAFVWNSVHLEALLVLGLLPFVRPRCVLFGPGNVEVLDPGSRGGPWGGRLGPAAERELGSFTIHGL